jgi:hypothetical protein
MGHQTMHTCASASPSPRPEAPRQTCIKLLYVIAMQRLGAKEGLTCFAWCSRPCSWTSAIVLLCEWALAISQSMTGEAEAGRAPPFELGNRVRKASGSSDRSSSIWPSTFRTLCDLQIQPKINIGVQAVTSLHWACKDQASTSMQGDQIPEGIRERIVDC